MKKKFVKKNIHIQLVCMDVYYKTTALAYITGNSLLKKYNMVEKIQIYAMGMYEHCNVYMA